MAVLVASSELEELLLICHRIAVMNHGRMVEVIDHDEATKERIMTAAARTAGPRVHRTEPQSRTEPQHERSGTLAPPDVPADPEPAAQRRRPGCCASWPSRRRQA